MPVLFIDEDMMEADAEMVVAAAKRKCSRQQIIDLINHSIIPDCLANFYKNLCIKYKPEKAYIVFSYARLKLREDYL